MSLRLAIARTVAYARYFKYSPNSEEILFWLNSSKTTPLTPKNQKHFPKLSKLEIKIKKSRLKNSSVKEKIAHQLLNNLKYFPFILLVGLTGSVAAKNAKLSDDIDVLIITTPNTLWLIRPFVLLYLSLIGKRRTKNTPSHKVKDLICPNLWLDYKNISLSGSRQSLYTAHEILQVVPIFDKKDTYQSFLKSNSWVKKHLANAYKAKISKTSKPKNLFFCSSLLLPINLLFYFLQLAIMSKRKSREEVRIGAAYFHTRDYQKDLSLTLGKSL